MDLSETQIPVFCIWKKLPVLQKAYIKVMAYAIYIYLFFVLYALYSATEK